MEAEGEAAAPVAALAAAAMAAVATEVAATVAAKGEAGEKAAVGMVEKAAVPVVGRAAAVATPANSDRSRGPGALSCSGLGPAADSARAVVNHLRTSATSTVA